MNADSYSVEDIEGIIDTIRIEHVGGLEEADLMALRELALLGLSAAPQAVFTSLAGPAVAAPSGPVSEATKRYDIQAYTEGYDDDRYAVLEVKEDKGGLWVKWSDVAALFATGGSL